MQSGRPEYAIDLACAGLLLVLSDRLLIWLLTKLVPDAAASLERIPHDQRVLLVGAPVALVFLGVRVYCALRARAIAARTCSGDVPP